MQRLLLTLQRWLGRLHSIARRAARNSRRGRRNALLRRMAHAGRPAQRSSP
jgi:hypothetical protein